MLCFVLLFTFLLQSICSKEESIELNDRILFLGDTNTLLGSTNPFGFINLFQKELSSTVQNVTIKSVGFRKSTTMEIFHKLESNILKEFTPSKVILILSNNEFHIDSSLPVEQNRLALESIIANFLHTNTSVIICSVLVDGEKTDGTNELDEKLEMHIEMTKTIASDYNVMFIDLYSPMMRYIGHVNIDNLSHSVLTHNGKFLNDGGHLLIAMTLLRAFKIKNSLMKSNSLLTEVHRVQKQKENLLRIENFNSNFIYEEIVSAV
jgi:hypothetical protein